MSDDITTYTKVHMNPLNPDADLICIEDIAHALSMLARANGHFPEFYSVGQHCIDCAREAAARGLDHRMILACLLHDASEAYLADITRPVKQYLPNYKEAERRLMHKIYVKFLGTEPDEKEARLVKEIDDTLFYYEFLHFMGEKQQDAPPSICRKPQFRAAGFQETEKEYLKLFGEVFGEDCWGQAPTNAGRSPVR